MTAWRVPLVLLLLSAPLGYGQAADLSEPRLAADHLASGKAVRGAVSPVPGDRRSVATNVWANVLVLREARFV